MNKIPPCTYSLRTLILTLLLCVVHSLCWAHAAGNYIVGAALFLVTYLLPIVLYQMDLTDTLRDSGDPHDPT
jgi:hypothetical protein